jgi:replicative DNA helicase
MHQSISHLEAVYAGDSNAGIGTGFYDLDNLTGGLHPNEMCVVAARPGVGKTALALNIASHVVLHLKQPVGFFSMEMSNVQLGLRLLSSASSVNIRQVEQRKCKVEVAAAKLTGAVTLFKDAPLYVDDSSMLNISQIRSRARRMVEQFGIKLFIIDYLQFIQSARRSDNRASDVAVISAGLKNIAKELNVPVMVMCQLNRESEKYQRAPRLSDLRESGSIEQDADTVITLHHEEEGVCVTIAKQRNGPMGQFRLAWTPEYTRFENYSPASEPSYAQND